VVQEQNGELDVEEIMDDIPYFINFRQGHR